MRTLRTSEFLVFTVLAFTATFTLDTADAEAGATEAVHSSKSAVWADTAVEELAFVEGDVPPLPSDGHVEVSDFPLAKLPSPSS
jgi:hypothetical protein